jgi:cation diffusion facilitator family transporter
LSGCDCEVEIRDRSESKTLLILLAINAVMFFVEFGLGLYSDSTALIADSLDMLADASVYGIALYAVGRSLTTKASAARISGVLQIVLGFGVLADIVRRLIVGSEPVSLFMMGVGTIALMANLVCLKLIYKHRTGDVHMRASWIFSKNDVIANIGVITGGVLVAVTGSAYPDLIMGLVIASIVIRGGVQILRDAARSR